MRPTNHLSQKNLKKAKTEKKKASSTNTFQYIFICKKAEPSMWKWEFFCNSPCTRVCFSFSLENHREVANSTQSSTVQVHASNKVNSKLPLIQYLYFHQLLLDNDPLDRSLSTTFFLQFQQLLNCNAYIHLLNFQRIDVHVYQVTNCLLKINQATIPQFVLNGLKRNNTYSVLNSF